MSDLVFRGTRDELKALLRAVPAALAGRGPDPSGACAALARAVGVEALSIVKGAFIEKSRGGTDEAGTSWPRLNPKTIAYGRRHPGLNAKRKRAAVRGRASRPLLTDTLDRLWRGVFASTYRRLRARGQSEGEAKGTAAATAWAVVKARGGKTILGTYGNTPVEIGRDTGRLLNSLSPVEGGADNRLEAQPGRLAIGSNVAYAAPFHKRRPLWPDDPAAWPQAWTDRLLQTAADGLKEVLRHLGA